MGAGGAPSFPTAPPYTPVTTDPAAHRRSRPLPSHARALSHPETVLATHGMRQATTRQFCCGHSSEVANHGEQVTVVGWDGRPWLVHRPAFTVDQPALQQRPVTWGGCHGVGHTHPVHDQVCPAGLPASAAGGFPTAAYESAQDAPGICCGVYR